MENQSVVDPKRPLLNEAYAYGVVEHPFPLNCLIRDWHLGPDFYNAVKIGIVQYVCADLLCSNFSLVSLFIFIVVICCLPEPFLQMILKMICALLAMILESFGVYGEGKFEWRYG